MKKIYLVSTGEYSDYRPICFANTREEAEEFCIKLAQHYDRDNAESERIYDKYYISYNGLFVEELEYCEELDFNDKEVVRYKCYFEYINGKLERVTYKKEFNYDIYPVEVIDVNENPYYRNDGIGDFCVAFNNSRILPEEKVWKIAQDYMYQYLCQIS